MDGEDGHVGCVGADVARMSRVDEADCRSRFSSGKPNALVIDVGANTTSVTPIWDGFVLKKGEPRLCATNA